MSNKWVLYGIAFMSCVFLFGGGYVTAMGVVDDKQVEGLYFPDSEVICLPANVSAGLYNHEYRWGHELCHWFVDNEYDHFCEE